ncbi:hypothetical protein QVD17_05208 [Tagetes erecta]|uniref:Uncharacterized protein n=1 Tax=Tagetes erecta TaxID=13708 RepID=A0AAD8LL17_TARER|nr:hypothetical protein QVD17_05208 [Tagetes erecta]
MISFVACIRVSTLIFILTNSLGHFSHFWSCCSWFSYTLSHMLYTMLSTYSYENRCYRPSLPIKMMH